MVLKEKTKEQIERKLEAAKRFLRNDDEVLRYERRYERLTFEFFELV